jgi:hypothetical protein
MISAASHGLGVEVAPRSRRRVEPAGCRCRIGLVRTARSIGGLSSGRPSPGAPAYRIQVRTRRSRLRQDDLAAVSSARTRGHGDRPAVRVRRGCRASKASNLDGLDSAPAIRRGEHVLGAEEPASAA